jgi:hypothetical protein
MLHDREVIAALKEELANLPPPERKAVTTREAIAAVADEIRSLRQARRSWSEISARLAERGIKVAESTLRTYLRYLSAPRPALPPQITSHASTTPVPQGRAKTPYRKGTDSPDGPPRSTPARPAEPAKNPSAQTADPAATPIGTPSDKAVEEGRVEAVPGSNPASRMQDRLPKTPFLGGATGGGFRVTPDEESL